MTGPSIAVAALSLSVLAFVVLSGLGHVLGVPHASGETVNAWSNIIMTIIGGLVGYISSSASSEGPCTRAHTDEDTNPE